jgi:D-glycero-beta-D-manno-heptose 1-phosphate adenylyltransferase
LNSALKIVSLNEAKTQIEAWKNDDLKVVFTNGCFDILHLGHVDYLEKARNLGHRLVIGLNTDASVSRLKGPSRPIVPQHARARVLAALAFVDLVVLFDDPTPYELIKALTPNYLVKGNDYNISTIVGADWVMAQGGEVKTIELTEGFSTSTIVQKIMQNYLNEEY